MVSSEKTGRGLWPSWSQSSRLPCGQGREGGLVGGWVGGWVVSANQANIFPPNYTGQVAMMVSRSIRSNFQWGIASSSWLVHFVTKLMGNVFMGIILACAPAPDLVKLVANQWLVRALHCTVLAV